VDEYNNKSIAVMCGDDEKTSVDFQNGTRFGPVGFTGVITVAIKGRA